MKKYILTLGLNDKDSLQPRASIESASNEVCNLLLRNKFEGASITSGRGFYKMASGAVVFEDFIKIEFLFVEPQKVLEFAAVLKSAFNQETIAFQTVDINSKLI